MTAEPSACRAAGFGRQAGAGEQGVRVLVQADRQDPRVVPERRLHAVAVVRVHVDVGDPLGALAQQPGDRDGRVVVDAEPAGVGRPWRGAGRRRCWRRAAPPRPDGPGRGQRGPGHQGGRLVHAGEHRVVLGAEPVHQQHALGHALLARSSRQRRCRLAARCRCSRDRGTSSSSAPGGRGRDLGRDPSRWETPKARASSMVSLTRIGAIG